MFQITNDNKYAIESKGLRIKNVKVEDGGVYNCSASGSINGETIDQHITAEVKITLLENCHVPKGLGKKSQYHKDSEALN